MFVLGWKFSIALMQTHPRDEVLGTSRSSFTISQKTAATDATPTRYKPFKMKLAFALPILSLNTCMQTSLGPSVHFLAPLILQSGLQRLQDPILAVLGRRRVYTPDELAVNLVCKTSKQTRTDAGGTLNRHAGTPRAEGNRTRNLLCPGADGADPHCGKISVNIPTASSLCTHSLCTDLAAHFSLASPEVAVYTEPSPSPTPPPPPTFPCVCVFTHGERVKCFRTCFSKLSPQTVVPTPRASSSSPTSSSSPNPGHLSAELLFLLLFSPDILQALAHARKKNADAAPLGRPLSKSARENNSAQGFSAPFLSLITMLMKVSSLIVARHGVFCTPAPVPLPPTLASG